MENNSNKEKKISRNLVSNNEECIIIPSNEPLNSRPIIFSREFVLTSIFPFLDRNQYLLFIFSLGVIKENATNLNNCKFIWKDFVARSLKHTPKYKDFEKSIDDLAKKIFRIKKPNGEYRTINWFEHIDHSDKENFNINTAITFKIHNELAKYLLKLQETPYVKSFYSIAAKLGNTRNFHLYYILKSEIDYVIKHKNSVEKEFELDALNTIFSSKYRYSHLNERILIPAIKTINSVSMLKVKYKPLKKGRKITKIRFAIAYNNSVSKLPATQIHNLELPAPKAFDPTIDQICKQIEQLAIVKKNRENLNRSTIFQLVSDLNVQIVENEIKEAIRQIKNNDAIIGKGTIIGWIINQVKKQTYTKNQEIQQTKARANQTELEFNNVNAAIKKEIEEPAYLNKLKNLEAFKNLNLSKFEIINELNQIHTTEPIFKNDIYKALQYMSEKEFVPEKEPILVELILRNISGDITTNDALLF